jgi:hypothetical protein
MKTHNSVVALASSQAGGLLHQPLARNGGVAVPLRMWPFSGCFAYSLQLAFDGLGRPEPPR